MVEYYESDSIKRIVRAVGVELMQDFRDKVCLLILNQRQAIPPETPKKHIAISLHDLLLRQFRVLIHHLRISVNLRHPRGVKTRPKRVLVDGRRVLIYLQSIPLPFRCVPARLLRV